jgi:hypothetical protein
MVERKAKNKMNEWIEIKKFKDLPKYGEYVLVCGINKKQYNKRELHVCEINDLEDSMDWRTKGSFHWLTENGTEIKDVTHWGHLYHLFQLN